MHAEFLSGFQTAKRYEMVISCFTKHSGENCYESLFNSNGNQSFWKTVWNHHNNKFQKVDKNALKKQRRTKCTV